MSTTNALREKFLDFIIRNDTSLFDGKLSDDQWQLIVTWCKEHRLTSVFVYKVKTSNVLLHNSYWDKLQNKANRAQIRQLKIKANLVHLNEVLKKNSIEYQIVKGPILAFKYYSDGTMRRMRDIDVIVKPECFSLACEILIEHGYTFGTESRKVNYQDYLESARHAPHLTHPDFNIIIEVHHRLFPQSGKQEDAELSLHPDFWSDSDVLRIGNIELPCESPEILLAHIIHHAVRAHNFNNGPLFIFDLYFLITKSNICWDKFRRYCDYLHLHREVGVAFSLLCYFYPKIELDSALFGAPSSKLINACKHLMLCDLEQNQYERLSSTLKSKSLKNQFRHMAALTFPSKAKMDLHLKIDSSRFYWLLLPVWWGLLIKFLCTQFFGGKKSTKTTKELTILYRWLNR